MTEKAYVEAITAEGKPRRDYTIQNTTRRIVILQHYPDSRDMPSLTSINQILREAGYNQSVKVTDRTVITHVYEF